MPLISPTICRVAGSIRWMLSPCELVCRIRTCADTGAATVTRRAARTAIVRMSATPRLSHHLIDAPDAGASRRDVEECETEQRRIDSAIHLRNKQPLGQAGSHRRLADLPDVNIEIRDGHLAAGEERRNARQQPDHHQKPAECFHDAGGTLERHQLDLLPAEPAEQLLQSEEEEDVAEYDAEQGIRHGRVAFWNHGANYYLQTGSA